MITDILTLDTNSCPYFTVNNSVNYVPVEQHSNANLILRNGLHKTTFREGESLNILSTGYMLPENFCMTELSANTYENCPLISIGLEHDINEGIVYIPGFNESGVYIPSENFENVMNKYVNPVNLGNSFKKNFHLIGVMRYGWNDPNAGKPQVSMINVPDKLNGRIFQIKLFVKIEHTWELT